MFFRTLAVAAAVGSAVAQRPSNTSICDYYTTALLTNNTAANQKTLLTLVVNTAVIGNCKSFTSPIDRADMFQILNQTSAFLSQVSSPQEKSMVSQSTFSHTSMVAWLLQTLVAQSACPSTSLMVVELLLS
jgi:hypothetical protein